MKAFTAGGQESVQEGDGGKEGMVGGRAYELHVCQLLMDSNMTTTRAWAWDHALYDSSRCFSQCRLTYCM